jgi:hypothetical protein
MKLLRFGSALAVGLAFLNLVLPLHYLTAAEPTVRRTVEGLSGPSGFRDVALGLGGRMRGQVLDAQGQPLATCRVTVKLAGQTVTETISDDHGRFEVRGLHGGVYHVSAADSVNVCRCWVAGTAPPAALNQLLLVAGSVERGQKPIGHILFSGPLLFGVITAAAIAIPLSVRNKKPAS